MDETSDWSGLTDAYGRAYDPRSALLTITQANPDEAYEELWERVHHQGDLGTAAYAIVPELVRLVSLASMPDWRAYALIATIEERRPTPGSPSMPSWLSVPYQQAMNDVVEPALKHLQAAKDDLDVRSLLAAIAQAKGQRTVGAITLWSEDEREEALGIE